MGFLNEQAKGGVANEAAIEAGTSVSKASKNSNYQKKVRERNKASAKKILDNRAYNLLPEDKAWLEAIAGIGTVVRSPFNGPTVLSKLYGDNPKVGQSVTLQEAWDKTEKARPQMSQQIKKWAEHGTIVEFIPNEATPKLSTYVIKALGN